MRYISGEQVFKSLSQDFSKMLAAQASRTILKICCKFFLVYLKTEGVVVGIIAIRKLGPKDAAGWSDILLPNSKGEKESRRVTQERSFWE